MLPLNTVAEYFWRAFFFEVHVISARVNISRKIIYSGTFNLDEFA
jgi:hypothetical protein